MNSLMALKDLGQHVWLDNLSRGLLHEGILQRLMKEDGVDGVTSNPAIFQKAIAGDPWYREDVERLHGSTLDPEARYEALVIPDIQAACDIFYPTYVRSAGDAGYPGAGYGRGAEPHGSARHPGHRTGRSG